MDNMPKKEDIIEALRQLHPEIKDIQFNMPESILIFGLSGGLLQNLDFIDDPIFLEAANATLGDEYPDGSPIEEEEVVFSKVPITISGYGLLGKNKNLIGIACFESQFEKED